MNILKPALSVALIAILLTILASFCVGVNYLFASFGEPRSLWLMQLVGLM